MKQETDRIQVIFNNNSDEISGVLHKCTSFILSNTSQPAESLLLSKIKWVLTELLTNAVKHCGTANCIIELTINESEIIVAKLDSGVPFHLKDSSGEQAINWPVAGNLRGTKHLIYSSYNEMLLAHIQMDGSVIFSIEEPADSSNESDTALMSISEHFGLLIIAKSSTNFSYKYDGVNRMNHFISKFATHSQA